MRGEWKFLPGWFALGLVPVAGNGAPGPGAVEAQLIALEHQWVGALQNRDSGALERLLADNFVDSAYNGALRTRQDVLDGLQAPRDYRSLRLEDLAVRIYGADTAIVNGVNVVQGSNEDQVVRVRFTDVFVLRQGRWQAVSAQETVQTNQ